MPRRALHGAEKISYGFANNDAEKGKFVGVANKFDYPVIFVSGWEQTEEVSAFAAFLARRTEENFHALFQIVAPRMLTYFRLRGCVLEIAEELTQETMLLVYRQAGTLRDRERFRPWLYQIARNVLLQHWRKRGREVETVDLEAKAFELAAPASNPELHSDFGRWMAALHPEERQVMTLRFVDGLEYHEIADLTGVPTGTVQWRVHNAKKKLAARFGPGESK